MGFPSLNLVILEGKLFGVTRIQWPDGGSSAYCRIATLKKVHTSDGYRTKSDFHDVEVWPGEVVFKQAWPGAIVQVQGTLETYEWTAKGATKSFTRTRVRAHTFQVLIPSDKPRETPATVLRTNKREVADDRDGIRGLPADPGPERS